MLKLLFVALFVCSSAIADVQIWHCPQPDGSKGVQDHPCGQAEPGFGGKPSMGVNVLPAQKPKPKNVFCDVYVGDMQRSYKNNVDSIDPRMQAMWSDRIATDRQWLQAHDCPLPP